MPQIIRKNIELCLQFVDFLLNRVGQVNLVEFPAGIFLLAIRRHDDIPGNADNRCIWRHFPQHNGIPADTHVIPDRERSKHLRACTHQHMIAERRMALALMLACAAQGYAVINVAIVADFGSLPNNNAHAVVDKQAFANLSAGVNLNPRQPAAKLRNRSGERAHAVRVQPMRNSMPAHGVIAGIHEKNLQRSGRRRVLRCNIFSVFPKAHFNASFLL